MRSKVEKVVRNCINCILAERKQGKQQGLLNSNEKGKGPLDTFYVDHLGPLPSTKKIYNHIFVVIDGLTKFVWLYATKYTSTVEVVQHLKKQSTVFGNPRRIISDRGTAFTSHDFQEYCRGEGIVHVRVTTAVPRGNCQVETVNRTLIPLLTKLAAPKPGEWFKYLDLSQKYLNATQSRSTRTTPFNLMFGINIKMKEDLQVREIIENEWITMFQENLEKIRKEAKEKLSRIQAENKKSYNRKKKKPENTCMIIW